MKLCKLLLAASGATIVLAALVSGASANRLSQSSSTLRATWTSAEFGGGFGTVRCSLTIESSLHSRTFTKTAGALAGYVTRASVGPCASGSATILAATLPWHLRYASFTGTLPSISSITMNVIGVAFQIREPTFGITCLATSTTTEPAGGALNRESGGAATSVSLGGTIETSCGIRGTLSGTSGAPTVAGATTRITLTLI